MADKEGYVTVKTVEGSELKLHFAGKTVHVGKDFATVQSVDYPGASAMHSVAASDIFRCDPDSPSGGIAASRREKQVRNFALVLALFSAAAGCGTRGSIGSAPPSGAPHLGAYTDSLELRAAAQRVVDAFAVEVAKARGAALADAPRVEVRNTPQLIFFESSSNRIVVPFWGTMPPAMRTVFGQFAGRNEEEASRLFGTVFNAFLIAHEAGHWWQARAKRGQGTLYVNEQRANELAVAFWRTQPGGERLLVDVERLVTLAAQSVPDPTPAGQDPVAYFGAHYQELGADPLKYGYYQFRFMRDAVRARATLDFARMVGREQ